MVYNRPSPALLHRYLEKMKEFLLEYHATVSLKLINPYNPAIPQADFIKSFAADALTDTVVQLSVEKYMVNVLRRGSFKTLIPFGVESLKENMTDLDILHHAKKIEKEIVARFEVVSV